MSFQPSIFSDSDGPKLSSASGQRFRLYGATDHEKFTGVKTSKSRQRADIKAAAVARWADPVIRARRVSGLRSAWQRENMQQKHTDANRETWKDPITRSKRGDGISAALRQSVKFRETVQDPARRLAASKRGKAFWSDPTYRARAVRRVAMQIKKGTNIEILALGLLVGREPLAGWVLNTSVIVSGKIPDLVRSDGLKVAVDVHGDYWHRNETKRDTTRRKKLFLGGGYRLVVIWEKELRKTPDVLWRRLRHAERLANVDSAGEDRSNYVDVESDGT